MIIKGFTSIKQAFCHEAVHMLKLYHVSSLKNGLERGGGKCIIFSYVEVMTEHLDYSLYSIAWERSLVCVMHLMIYK